jgi:phage-related protein|tara:strand:+ start:38 stop:259 length:222 start_codon:yes stop_codon:yes gene_type:complete
MPIKFKPSQTVIVRGTSKKVTTHYYMKQVSKEELFKEINADKPNKKRRAKCIRELERRGVNISWTSIPKDSIA